MKNSRIRPRRGACFRRAGYALSLRLVRSRRDRQRTRELGAGKPYNFGDFKIICERGAADEVSVTHVAIALGLIHDVHPRLFRRIRRDLKVFYLRAGAGAQYWSRLGVCVLEARQDAEGHSHEIALKIVHEATHARLHAAGIPWTPDSFERVERRCILEEVAFCKRLAERGYNVAERVGWYEKRLERPVHTRELLRDWHRRDRDVRRTLHHTPSSTDPVK